MKQLIKANPKFTKKGREYKDLYLDIVEFFYDSIQGEGITTGYPAAFLRLQGCTLNCKYCDTKLIRDKGNPYTFTELFKLMEQCEDCEGRINLIQRLKSGQHLVITGGSPLKQQEQLIGFLQLFTTYYKFKPFIELENECTITPHTDMLRMVNIWNNSPKLSNSGNPYFIRYKPDIIKLLSCLSNFWCENKSWFKFVICSPNEDWEEIKTDFIAPGYILKKQIILMPQGRTKKEILKNSPAVVKLAVQENVRFSLREHIVLWNNKIGV